MSDLKDNLKKKSNLNILGFSKEVKRVELGLCPACKDPIRTEDFKDPLSFKEYNISGLCQKCQDSIFE